MAVFPYDDGTLDSENGVQHMADTILEMKGITKVYPNGIVATKDMNFSVKKGEIHALAGENGAGKTTLMKILFGIEPPEQGQILIHGQPVQIKSPIHAIEHGIGMVHQHFMLVPSFTVAENIVLGIEPKRRGKVDMNKAIALTKEYAQKYQLEVDPMEKAENLPVGIKQRVEILKALVRGVDILILDEPTAVLTPQETKELFKQLILFKEQGNTIIFISHKLDEIKALCDRITIMRAGKNMGTYQVADVTTQEISRLMVGRDVVLKMDKAPATPGVEVLRIDGLDYTAGKRKLLDHIRLRVKAGSILGVAGVEGNGQNELVDCLTGKRHVPAGVITVGQQGDIGELNIREIRDLDVSHIPADRMVEGVAAEGKISENLITDQYSSSKLSRYGFQNKKAIQNFVNELIAFYQIKCDSGEQTVGMLSGGYIQKVVVARELSKSPRLVIANQPTRGVDVGAAEFIHSKLLELRDQGSGIFLVSADLNEVLGLSDELIVMHNGKISAYFPNPSQVNEEELGRYMLGIAQMTPEQLGGMMDEATLENGRTV